MPRASALTGFAEGGEGEEDTLCLAGAQATEAPGGGAQVCEGRVEGSQAAL
jgi:hypothetical protein